MTCSVLQITYSLLPHLYKSMDDDMLNGTFQTIEDYEKNMQLKRDQEEEEDLAAALSTTTTLRDTPLSTPIPMSRGESTPTKAEVQIVGRPLDLEELEDDTKEKPAASSASTKAAPAPSLLDYLDTDDSESEDDMMEDTFAFSKNIQNPAEVLQGVNPLNGQPLNYCKVVGDETDTICELNNREIIIKGYSQRDLKEAAQRFRNIQKLYKARRRPTIIVPCVHYPTQSDKYWLYFANLNRYAHKSFVDLMYADSLRPYYVLLPVFKDPVTNQLQKPKDLLDVPVAPPPPPQQQHQAPMAPVAAAAVPARRPAPPRTAAPPQQKQLPPQAHAMRPAPQQQQPSPGYRMATGPTPSAYMNAPTYQQQQSSMHGEGLWGEDRGFSNNYAATGRTRAPMLSPTTPRPTNNYSNMSPNAEDFPALPVNNHDVYPTPTMAPPQQQPQRRVMRIMPQQSTRNDNGGPVSLLEQAKQYNLHNMQTGLSEALDGIRGFRGEIQLSAKLGKVLWTNLTSEIQRKTWEFGEIKDIVVKEHGVRPLFNDVTTAYEEIITPISEILPKPYNRTACFEIHAKARNQPALPYKPVVLIMNQGIVEFKKVITRKTKVAEIDWVSLDRKFDFQMSLTTHELGRPDVKPYTTFLKKISVCPITSQLTYENVRDFLEVDHILYKQKTRYRIHFPFVVEITRVERVPIKLQPSNGYGTEKFLGLTGKGEVWYDFQVYYTLHDEAFKSNLNLGVGKLPSWDVDSILGPQDQPNALIDYVKCLLLLVEKCEPLFNS
ncbi:hypothetical protein RO3G_04598 [Lichtheimia corymbifera JMRC:FSU:9682]|uniref:DUF7905 domain-containing protein n=1 Tax=Lichtheimia corymbifera JMRC:FSU:9682 TaxID=1263082 RepID=A0A068SFY7_9FUNG|nr:hypothetical protein RO3G_04598 [Lichtheimia corymbifera JMRC:FSU:9682]